MKHAQLGDSLLGKTIAQTAPHDHLCLLYETPQEQLAAAISFIRIGLERGEQCIYIVDHHAAETIADAMRQEGIDVDAALQSHALIIAQKRDAYLIEGHFDPDRMISFLEQAVHSAERAGFSALRVTGEMTWAMGGDSGTERLIEYEAKLNRFFSKHNVSAICQYDRKRFSPEVLLDVIRTHPKVISGGVVCRNHYYVPPDEFFSENAASLEVDRLLNNIIDREKSEIALRESKVHLELKNMQLEREIADHRRADERLDLYRRIVASANDAIGIIDPNGFYLEQNKSHQDLIGYSDEALQGKTPAIHLGEEGFGRVSEELTKKGTYRGEHASRTRSGEKIHVDLSAFTMRNEAGEIVCHVGIKRDITERKRMEETLRESENRLRRQNRVLASLARNQVETADIKTSLQEITEASAQTLEVERVSIWLYNEDRSQIHSLDLYERSLYRHSAGSELRAEMYPSYFEALELERIIPAHDAHTDPRTREFSESYLTPFGITSMLDAPIWLNGKMVGVVCHEHVGPPRRWTAEEQNFAASIADITALAIETAERRRAEEALNASQSRYKGLVDSIDGIVWEVDISTYRFTFVSRQAERILGYPVARWLNEPGFWKDRIHPDDREWAVAFCAQKTREMCDHDFEYRMMAADGRAVWLRDLVTVIVENGRPVTLRGVMIDVTEQKRTGEALHRAHAELAIKMEQLQRQLGVSHALHQISSRFIHGEKSDFFLADVVKRMARMTQAARCGIALIDSDRKAIRPHAFYGFDEETMRPIEAPLVQDEGDPIYRLLYRGETLHLQSILSDSGMERYRPFIERLGIQSILAVPLQIGSVPLGIFYLCDKEGQDPFTFEDIQLTQTIANQLALAIANQQYAANLEKVNRELQQKKIEAEEASRLKSHFLSNVSHELRTPLNAIVGYSHLLREEVYGALNEAQRPALEGIQRNARDLSQLISDVLDLAKIEAGKMSVDLSEVHLPALVDEVAAGIRPLSEKKSLPIRCVVEPGLPRINSDESKIKQIIVNLLSNAVKFTSKGEITVHLRTWPDRNGVELAVQDTGIGIRPEDLPRIFDTFHQVDGATTREFGGVGLGLAIVKELLHLLEGEIRVESEHGKGSTFTVLLPVRNQRSH
ncbi:MAG: MEDS domain-containing protein [Candidatus Manganitrophus sp.]|nr:MEDS domain-containing protein [Candidatus Manganitrophus sp.]MDC4227141.1 MEDS domain-containing protein [Candidatus Manganitrophus sp.]WDT71462.1 MAG: MEDS domain-containing protein [Candidatus Manganitrophus sp.]